MIFNKKSKILGLVAICILVCMMCTGCNIGNEPLKMKVTSGKTEIPNLITKEVWDGESPKAVNPFQVYAKKNKKIISLKKGDSICMEFQGKFKGEEPEKIELQIFALNKDGSFKDPDADPQIVEVELKGKKVEFEVPDYSMKAKVYGYDLRCTWGEDICRYNYIIK